MKTYNIINILLAVTLAVFPLLSAKAQVQAQDPAPVAPAAPAPTSSLDVFPRLPQSTFCTKEKLVGTWKLLMIYEVPSGSEIAKYTSNPLQYYIFEQDGRYGEYVSILRAITMKEVRESVITKQQKLQQFTLNKTGLMYLYRDGIVTDSLACFLVASANPPFMTGQMLLMPPEKASRGRLVKVYQKMYPELETPPAVLFKAPEPVGDSDSE